MLRNMYRTYKAFAYAYAIASITAFAYECIRISLKEAHNGRTATTTTQTA
jgi:hypothetical protein